MSSKEEAPSSEGASVEWYCDGGYRVKPSASQSLQVRLMAL
jgi:hypothetical protein